ncbi:hypothetical protein QBZ16_001479 [Prototheca wickerhamii]|uniref:Coiled-coil domain-containing protein 86 n=1 Tax=Prototheca wickerhamii TaxID=3111 RepID=A0AAD9MK55_PROWI|nr:hypothetical protein QBZ16_001479 [Prototheca wickerhamii]
MEEAVPVPPQYQPQPVTDFRAFADGPRGYKVEEEKDTLLPLEEQAPVGRVKRPKHNTVGAGKESGRSWKQPGQRASSLRNPQTALSWEKRMKDKAEKAAFLAQKREALAAFKAKKSEAKAQREASRQRKEENRKASDLTVAISSATAKKLLKSKKGRKQIRTA